MTYYLAHTDENDVLCVDQIEGSPGDEDIQELAEVYDHVIYFAFPETPEPEPETVEGRLRAELALLRRHMEEQVELLRSEIDDLASRSN